MTGRIPSAFIDDLLARTDIVELIGSRLQLRKAGKEYQARCPFHDEKTPSFTVSPDKQFYHCFGCGAHGTAIGFLMEYDRLNFREAIEELAQRLGLDVPDVDQPIQQRPDLGPLYQLLEQADRLFRHQLREHPAAAQAIDYLKSRGLTGEIAARYGIGFAPPGGDFLLSQLGAESVRQHALLECGLIAEQDGRRYDRFRNRIMFPIRDRRGRVIGFGGRILGEGKPKYLNSPETPLFHKGRELYGLFEAQRSNRKLDALLIVEGYLDVIALAQFGLSNVVATLGTATTPEHLQHLLRAAPDLMFCFDGDGPGRTAAWKALETALPFATGRQSIRFLFLPEGEDPDTLVRKEGREAWSERLKQALPLSRFLFDHLCATLDMTTADDRARLATLAQPLIDRIPPGPFRDLMQQRLAELVGVPIRGRSQPPRHNPPRRTGAQMRLSLIAQAIALLINYPELSEQVDKLPDAWRRAPTPGAKILAQLVEMTLERPTITKAMLLERWREHQYFAYLQQLSIASFLRDVDEQAAVADFNGALQRLAEEVRKHEWLQAFNRAAPADSNQETPDHVEHNVIDPGSR